MKLNNYYCWAEHTQGRSVDHCCTTGIFNDPTDEWEHECEAQNEEVAMGLAEEAFAKYTEQPSDVACACGAYPGYLTKNWYDSVVIIVSRKPYPDAIGDEDI